MLARTAIYIRSAYTQDQVQDCLAQLQDTVAARGWTVVTVQVDRMIGVAKGRSRLPGLAAVLGAVVRHEVDAIVVSSLHHLGFSVESLLETLAELHRHGVKLVVHDHADAVETGGLLAAADLLVEARRAYRRENIVAGQIRARASGVRFGRPPVPPSRLAKVRVAIREGQGVREAARSCAVSAAKVSRIKAEMIGAERLT
jgi:DNA invertase Pin-like site-specific DNA recombinase